VLAVRCWVTAPCGRVSSNSSTTNAFHGLKLAGQLLLASRMTLIRFPGHLQLFLWGSKTENLKRAFSSAMPRQCPKKVIQQPQLLQQNGQHESILRAFFDYISPCHLPYSCFVRRFVEEKFLMGADFMCRRLLHKIKKHTTFCSLV
jgi:hypothetical protein